MTLGWGIQNALTRKRQSSMGDDEDDGNALEDLKLLYSFYRQRARNLGGVSVRILRLPSGLDEAHRFFYQLIHNQHPRVLRENMRFFRDQYHALYNICEPYIPATIRSPHEVLGVTLHWLATGSSAREQETKFSIAHSTCHDYRHIGVRVIIRGLRHTIQVPRFVPRDFARKFPYFDQAVCAIDGVHIPIVVTTADSDRFRSRKGTTSTNVLGASDWNMRVCYAYVGVEGSAHDSTVLALSRFLAKIPDNHYVLADAGYALSPKVLTPYRGVRYHLSEWAPDRQGRPRSPHKLFNLRHAKARNVVERMFGIIKRRFKILRITIECEMKTAKLCIFLAFCLHNFLRDYDREDHAEDFSIEDQNGFLEGEVGWGEGIPFDFQDATNHREYMVRQMWDEYGQLIWTYNIDDDESQ